MDKEEKKTIKEEVKETKKEHKCDEKECHCQNKENFKDAKQRMGVLGNNSTTLYQQRNSTEMERCF